MIEVKRPLFVFAGQSNMMGAAVYPASRQIFFKNSYEYMHRAKRFGEVSGAFKNYGFPSGEFSYKNLTEAYGENPDISDKSKLSGYTQNTYFCPSMCNLKNDEDKSTDSFDSYSEESAGMGVCLPPYIVKGLEEEGYACVYAHIAKGSVNIKYYTQGDGAAYFCQKSSDFFADSSVRFCGDDTSERVLFWLQGECDAQNGYDEYKKSLEKLWSMAKKIGFKKFFIIRVGYWGKEAIADVMRAQEDFCKENIDAYMITRVCSYFAYKGQNMQGWFKGGTLPAFTYCRDSFYGFLNQHINEKGFKVIAQYALPNIIRILFENKAPILEEERIIPLIEKNDHLL